jgi:hypothetical protein
MFSRNCVFVSHPGCGGPREQCSYCSPDLKNREFGAPGPISYSAVLGDARRLRWTKCDEPATIPYMIELGTVYIGACWNEEARVWMLGRVFWCEECMHFEVYQEGVSIHHRDHSPARISHFAPDMLGTPYDAPVGTRLRS